MDSSMLTCLLYTSIHLSIGNNIPGDKNMKYTNELINETSPYLREHAHNPVNWHAWNDQVFEKAKKENKPIFLSIGYSSCHWCHVMAKECFEDEEVAKTLNKEFLCINCLLYTSLFL